MLFSTIHFFLCGNIEKCPCWREISGDRVALFLIQETIFLSSESVLVNDSKGTEADISSAVSVCLKYAPDRCGGGGRKK